VEVDAQRRQVVTVGWLETARAATRSIAMRLASIHRHLPSLVMTLALLLGACVSTSARAAELLMFELRGCPWCIKWHREIGPAYPRSSEGLRAPLRIVDIKAPLPGDLSLDRPVTSSPTFVLVDEGREIGRITGYPGAEFFWGLLDELLARLDDPPRAPAPGQRSL
jgi:hypothetical protein